jgi:hypothetical protein
LDSAVDWPESAKVQMDCLAGLRRILRRDYAPEILMSPALAAALMLSAVQPLASQTQDLATTHDGNVLYLATEFRLRGETDVRNALKIYRYQNGTWTRMAADANSAVLYTNPYVSEDGSVVGWSIGYSDPLGVEHRGSRS